MNYSNQLLVKNNPTLFDTINFNLTWITDANVRDELKNHFRLQEMIYDDIEEMKIALQERADESYEYLNRLYVLQTKNLTYNPVENYSMEEVETPAEITYTTTPAETTVTDTPAETTVTTNPAETTTTNNASSKGYGYNGNDDGAPTSSGESTVSLDVDTAGTSKIEVDTAGTSKVEVDTAGTSKLTVDENRTLTRHGNIGVTTGAQMLQGEAQIAEILFKLRRILCEQFDDLFIFAYDVR